MKISQLFYGIAIGALTGASAVLLSTPKSGNDLRSSIKTTSSVYKEKLLDAKSHLKELNASISDLTKEIKEVIPSTVNEMKTSVQQFQRETAPLQQNLQAEILSIQTAIESLEQKLPKKNQPVEVD